jgi:hypothetical protein
MAFSTLVIQITIVGAYAFLISYRAHCVVPRVCLILNAVPPLAGFTGDGILVGDVLHIFVDT